MPKLFLKIEEGVPTMLNIYYKVQVFLKNVFLEKFQHQLNVTTH